MVHLPPYLLATPLLLLLGPSLAQDATPTTSFASFRYPAACGIDSAAPFTADVTFLPNGDTTAITGYGNQMVIMVSHEQFRHRRFYHTPTIMLLLPPHTITTTLGLLLLLPVGTA